MKSRKLVSEKLFSKQTIKTNKDSLTNFREYKKVSDDLDKIRFPFGKQTVFKQVGANTTDASINFYGHTTG